MAAPPDARQLHELAAFALTNRNRIGFGDVQTTAQPPMLSLR